MPEKADALRRQLHAWRRSAAAQMPTPNPDHDPEADTRQQQKATQKAAAKKKAAGP
jgi:hypothetical protein